MAEKDASSYKVSLDLSQLKLSAKKLLTDYVGLEEEEIVPHVLAMRDKAWATCPYGCVGLFAFTWPTITMMPQYEQILDRTKEGQTLLDLGCGFGQNIRQLCFDGAPFQNLAGADLSREFIDCGYDYFRDKEQLQSKFVVGNILNGSSVAFKSAEGTYDIVYASMFYHLWDWDDQLKALIQSVKLLKPSPGATLLGWQLGSLPGGRVDRRDTKRRPEQKFVYSHDETSWKKLWAELEVETGTIWDVQVKSIVTAEIKEKQKTMEARDGMELRALLFQSTRL